MTKPAQEIRTIESSAPESCVRRTQQFPLGHEQLFRYQSRKLLNQSTLGRYRLVSPEWLERTGGVASRKY